MLTQIIAAVMWMSLLALPLHASAPFWTEKSSYVEGEYFYAVGMATSVKTEEEGRKAAFDNALQEISNYIRLTDLKDAPVETQMTYAVKRANGSLDVYRLVRVDKSKLAELKEAQIRMDEASRAETLRRITDETESKRRYMAAQATKMEELKQTNLELAQLSRRVKDLTANARSKFVKGMTMSEAERLIGRPRGMAPCGDMCVAFNYGTAWIHMRGGIASCVGSSAQACDKQ